MCLVSMRVMVLLVGRTNMPPIFSSTGHVSFRFSISCGKCVCLCSCVSVLVHASGICAGRNQRSLNGCQMELQEKGGKFEIGKK
jgi:hypothetical protein